MAIHIDFKKAKQYAEALQESHPSEEVQNLVNGFLVLYRQACPQDCDVPESMTTRLVAAALSTAGHQGMYSQEELMRAARESDWAGFSIMAAFNEGVRSTAKKTE